MACKEEYNDVLNNKTKAERYRFRILSAYFHNGASLYSYHDRIGLRIRHKRSFILFGLHFTACHDDVPGQEPDDLQFSALIFFFLHIMHILSGYSGR